MPYKLISALALGGTALTAYLAVSKLSGAPVVCLASGGCGSVLNSEYATVFGIPLSLLGLGAYSAVAALSIRGILSQSSKTPVSQYGVLAGGAVLASCSASLLYVLLTRFEGEACTWCLTSAGLSFGILAAACSGFSRSRQLQDVAPQGGGLIAATILFLSLAWSGIDPQGAEAVYDIPYQAATVTTQSSSRGEQLAKRLNDAGAKMYGAFWCSHCHEQKEAFGSQAMKDFPYVECYPDGFHKFDDLAKQCKDANIQAFPAWIIKGQTYSGAQSFDKLEKILDSQ
ncbi:hypothetical protein WJX79_005429 [Trebouxia sp. C0005]